MCISAVTPGEPVYGAEKPAKPEQNLTVIEGLTTCLNATAFDAHAAEHFAELARNGKPIGPYDMIDRRSRMLNEVNYSSIRKNLNVCRGCALRTGPK